MKKCTSILSLLLAVVLALSTAAPALAAESAADFPVHATAAILVDADYNEVLFAHNADEKRYPASITKVMTSLLALEAVSAGRLTLDTPVTLENTLYTGIGEGGSTQDLKPGETLTIRDLLHCALLPSANEACNALAVAVSGSIPAFVELMNSRAAELGMTGTHFNNAHGYHDPEHYTTARDISVMALEAMKHPTFREIVSSVKYVIPATEQHEQRVMANTNYLVSTSRIPYFFYRHAIGVKTGSTPEAGYCLVSAAEKDGHTMLAVVLGGENWKIDGEINPNNYFIQSKDLLEHGFRDFERKTILDGIQPIETLPVAFCREQDYVTVQPASSLEACLPRTLDPASFQRTVELPESLEAPIEKGQVVGSLTLTHEGQEYGRVDLVAASALERSSAMYTAYRVRTFFSQLWVKLLLLVLVLLLLVVLVKKLLFPARQKSRYGSSRSRGVYHSNYRGRGRR